MRPELRQAIIELLDAHRVMALTTLREDGFPQTTMVHYVNDGIAIVFGCSGRSQKARNLARDPRVSLAIGREQEDWNDIRGLSIGGLARRLAEFDEIVAATDRFVERFPQVHAFPLEAMVGTVFFRIEPKAVCLIDYTQGFGHSELVSLG